MTTADAQTWVVMEGRSEGKPFFAWCRWTGGPGFADVILTATDGMSEAPEIDPAKIRLEHYLFQVDEGGAWLPHVEHQYTFKGPDTGEVGFDPAWKNTIPTLDPEPMDPQAAVIMALTELGEDAVLELIAQQGTKDVLADPTIVTGP